MPDDFLPTRLQARGEHSRQRDFPHARRPPDQRQPAAAQARHVLLKFGLVIEIGGRRRWRNQRFGRGGGGQLAQCGGKQRHHALKRLAFGAAISAGTQRQRVLQTRAVFAGFILAGNDQVVPPAQVVEHRPGLGRAQVGNCRAQSLAQAPPALQRVALVGQQQRGQLAAPECQRWIFDQVVEGIAQHTDRRANGVVRVVVAAQLGEQAVEGAARCLFALVAQAHLHAPPQLRRGHARLAAQLLADGDDQRAFAGEVATAALAALQAGNALAGKALAQAANAFAADAEREGDLAHRPAFAQQRRQDAVAPQRRLVIAELGHQLGAAKARKFHRHTRLRRPATDHRRPARGRSSVVSRRSSNVQGHIKIMGKKRWRRARLHAHHARRATLEGWVAPPKNGVDRHAAMDALDDLGQQRRHRQHAQKR